MPRGPSHGQTIVPKLLCHGSLIHGVQFLRPGCSRLEAKALSLSLEAEPSLSIRVSHWITALSNTHPPWCEHFSPRLRVHLCIPRALQALKGTVCFTMLLPMACRGILALLGAPPAPGSKTQVPTVPAQGAKARPLFPGKHTRFMYNHLSSPTRDPSNPTPRISLQEQQAVPF